MMSEGGGTGDRNGVDLARVWLPRRLGATQALDAPACALSLELRCDARLIALPCGAEAWETGSGRCIDLMAGGLSPHPQDALPPSRLSKTIACLLTYVSAGPRRCAGALIDGGEGP